jgi:subtilisin family serine protease
MSRRRPKRECRFEPLEPRLCLSADLGPRLLEWNGQWVEAHADAWVVRAISPKVDGAEFAAAAPAALADGWRGTDLGEGFWALSAPGASVQQVRAWAADTAWVDYVEPDFVITGQALPNDPSFGQLWGLHNTGQSGGVVDADIDAPEAWNVTTGSRNVVIAVIDTGVDYTHRDLAANIWQNPGEIPGDGIDNDGNGFIDDVYGWDFVNRDADPMDDEGHGTHVAGTIGAVGNNGSGVTGVAWNVSIMPLKFLDRNGSGTTTGAIAALNYATRMRRDFGVNIVATNNSWGGGGPSIGLRDAIEAGGRAGILFVAAAGNEANNNDAFASYPASYEIDAIISVAATTRKNELASFSNYGLTRVDIGAPGQQIYSTLPGNSYGSYSGTSMAAPHVAGTVALLASAVPTATAPQIRSAILSSAVPVAALAGKVASGGLLNAAAALAVLTDTIPAPNPDEPDPVEPDPGVPGGPGEPDDSLATATPVTFVGGAATFSGIVGDGFFGTADVDLFAVNLTAGMTFTVDVDAWQLATPSTLDSFVRVFDGAGRVVAWNDDAGGSLDSFLTNRVAATGTYYVGVSSFGNSAYDPRVAGSGSPGTTVGGYTLRLGAAAPVVDAGDALGRSLRIDATAAASSGVRLTGYVGDGPHGTKDVDMYRIALRKGQRLTVDVNARNLPGSSTLDSYLRLFNSGGRQLTFNDDFGGSADSLLVFTAPKKGSYYVGVSGFGNASYAAKRAGSGRSGSIGGYEVTFTIGVGTLRGSSVADGSTVTILGFSDQVLAERLRQQVAFAALATGWLGGQSDPEPTRLFVG